MKKLFVLMLGILWVSVFILVAPAPGQGVIELKFSNYLPERTVLAREILEPWGLVMNLNSNKKVKITFFHGGTLGHGKDAYDIAVSGVADVSWTIVSYILGRVPKSQVFTLPFLCSTSSLQNSLAMWKMFPKYFEDEYKGVKVLWIGGPQGVSLFTVNKHVKTIEDFKGMKIAVHPSAARAAAALGAVPVSLTLPEMYEALQRGVVEGVFHEDMMAKDFRFYEVCKYKTVMAFYTFAGVYFMNLDRYNKLPDDIKTVLLETSGTRMSFRNGGVIDFANERARRFLLKQGMKSYTLPESEVKKAIRKVQPIYDDWVKAVEAKGHPGQKILDEARKSLDYFKGVDRTVWLD